MKKKLSPGHEPAKTKAVMQAHRPVADVYVTDEMAAELSPSELYQLAADTHPNTDFRFHRGSPPSGRLEAA